MFKSEIQVVVQLAKHYVTATLVHIKGQICLTFAAAQQAALRHPAIGVICHRDLQEK